MNLIKRFYNMMAVAGRRTCADQEFLHSVEHILLYGAEIYLDIPVTQMVKAIITDSVWQFCSLSNVLQ